MSRVSLNKMRGTQVYSHAKTPIEFFISNYPPYNSKILTSRIVRDSADKNPCQNCRPPKCVLKQKKFWGFCVTSIARNLFCILQNFCIALFYSLLWWNCTGNPLSFRYLGLSVHCAFTGLPRNILIVRLAPSQVEESIWIYMRTMILRMLFLWMSTSTIAILHKGIIMHEYQICISVDIHSLYEIYVRIPHRTHGYECGYP